MGLNQPSCCVINGNDRGKPNKNDQSIVIKTSQGQTIPRWKECDDNDSGDNSRAMVDLMTMPVASRIFIVHTTRKEIRSRLPERVGLCGRCQAAHKSQIE